MVMGPRMVAHTSITVPQVLVLMAVPPLYLAPGNLTKYLPSGPKEEKNNTTGQGPTKQSRLEQAHRL